MTETLGNSRTKWHTQECLANIARQQIRGLIDSKQMKGLIDPNLSWYCMCPVIPLEQRVSVDRCQEQSMCDYMFGDPEMDKCHKRLPCPDHQAQPAPVANDLPAVWGLVMKDMVDRDQTGRKRYGVPLQPHNGRDVLRDAYEEALDLVAYLRQAIYERDNPPHCPDCTHLLSGHVDGKCTNVHGWTFVQCGCTRSVPR